MKILVVEDQAVSRMVFDRVLQRLGYLPMIVSTGEEAIEILYTETFDVVLTDWMLPGVSGLEVVRTVRVRDLENKRYTYVMFVTGLSAPGDAVEGLQAGADDFVVKPVDGNVFAAKLEVAAKALQRTCGACGSKM